jgi:hypothetical protein
MLTNPRNVLSVVKIAVLSSFITALTIVTSAGPIVTLREGVNGYDMLDTTIREGREDVATTVSGYEEIHSGNAYPGGHGDGPNPVRAMVSFPTAPLAEYKRFVKSAELVIWQTRENYWDGMETTTATLYRIRHLDGNNQFVPFTAASTWNTVDGTEAWDTAGAAGADRVATLGTFNIDATSGNVDIERSLDAQAVSDAFFDALSNHEPLQIQIVTVETRGYEHTEWYSSEIASTALRPALLVEVPEPAAFSLLVVGSLALCTQRRRQ